jgi:hypothetical protein
MKKLITIISVVAIVFASCTSSKNGVVLKRKYNKGFYVSTHHKSSDVKNTESARASSVDLMKTNSIIAIELPKQSTDLEITATPISENVNEVNSVKEIKHNSILVDSKSDLASIKTPLLKKAAHVLNVEKSSSAKGGSDSQLILLVILSLFPFLALLAMYLKDGKQITLNFWVDLILHLTFIGYLIFALLVVLDIINLA